MCYVENYKYLGCWVNEHGSHDKTVQALTAAAGRSYGRIVGLFKTLGDLGYKSFVKLYSSCVLPVANYGAAVWGWKDYPAPRVLQHKISSFYLGCHKYAPNSAVSIEMDIPEIQTVRWQDILRYSNRVW